MSNEEGLDHYMQHIQQPKELKQHKTKKVKQIGLIHKKLSDSSAFDRAYN